jgi:hypothetical protein
MPHDFLDQPRIPRLCHCHRTKCVAGAVQLQGIWDSELSSKLSELSERVLDPAQSDVTRCRFLGRKNPTFRLPQVFKLNVPEQSDDALASCAA